MIPFFFLQGCQKWTGIHSWGCRNSSGPSFPRDFEILPISLHSWGQVYHNQSSGISHHIPSYKPITYHQMCSPYKTLQTSNKEDLVQTWSASRNSYPGPGQRPLLLPFFLKVPLGTGRNTPGCMAVICSFEASLFSKLSSLVVCQSSVSLPHSVMT